MVAAAILVATSGHLKDGCRIHGVDFCSAFFGLLFSASCKEPCRIDTAYVKDGYNISVFVSCKLCAPANLPPRRTAARAFGE